VIRLDDEALVAALSDEARRVAAADAAGEPTPGAWHRLEARRAELGQRGVHRDGRWWAVRGALGAAAGAAALALVLGLHGWRTARPLTYDVGDGAVEEGGYIRGAAGVGAKVQFSDGTRIELGAGARMSVVAPGAHGARLRVEEGQAHFAVNHLPHAAWSVEAGPYVIEVTGTVFDVRWSGADEIVEVRLHTGSVRVSGPMLAEHATLRPGQHLTARLATRDLRIDETGTLGGSRNPPATTSPGGADRRQRDESGTLEEHGANPDAATAPTLTVPPPLAQGVPAVDHETAPTARPPAPAHTLKAPPRTLALADKRITAYVPEKWSARVSAGDAAGVVAEAVAHGIDATVAEADGPELVALADAARYGGRKYLAERALRAQRTRFPGTPAASTAAFFLGRLADDRGAATEGLGWYRRYLTEAPQGAYAAEALGREMVGVSRLSGRQAARELARDYLDRFPDGTYLLAAQAILQGR
jgi:ferric-dicitrate binding protein FerR (iron transport regulator)/TolA-binding protein